MSSYKSLFFVILALASTSTGSALISAATEIEAADQLATAPQITPTEATIAQRKTFLAAEKALKRGQLKRYRRLESQLDDYPLRPYLEYTYLRKRLQQTPSAKIELFLQQNKGSLLQQRLHSSWLSSLARNQRWQQYLKVYQPGRSVRQQCQHRWALHQTGHQQQAFMNIEKLWLVGRSRPRSCNQIFKAWQTAGHISTEQVWQRFQLAMQARKIKLAKHLVTLLPAKQQTWARLWLRVHRKPQLVTNEQRFSQYHPMRNQILIHGIQRMSYRRLDQAVKNWDLIQHRYTFNQTQRNGVERSLALRHAKQGHPEALSWLASLADQEHSDLKVAEWRIRAALRQQNWDAVLNGIHLLDQHEQNTLRWRYWRARALEALNQQDQAYDQYWALAQRRSYYSFLAADRLGISYQFDNQAVAINTIALDYLEQLPGMIRARELFALGRTLAARREWRHTTRHLPENLLQQAATIADQWGWHDRAILTMARTRYRDDLDLRFPLAYRDKVAYAARKQQIDPALAFALIRQESAFTADIRSPAGAMGLMQLMPRTARQTARNLGFRLRHKAALIDASTNLKLGMSHLRRVMDRYQNNSVLATAAYNAGAYRVQQWIPKQGLLPADIWTETIPFTETRNYVQNILIFTTIYEQHLGQLTTTLRQRMPPIGTPDAVLAASGNHAGRGPS